MIGGVAGADRTTVLAQADELERRDAELSAVLSVLDGLLQRVDAVRRGGGETRTRLRELPAELARLDRVKADAHGRLERAQQAVGAAERRLADGDQDDARRRLEQAQAALAEARAAVERLARRREELVAEEQRARQDVERLEDEARRLAAALRDAPGVSSTASEPGRGLDAVGAWAEQADATLFVARGNLERERDRILRETAELGTSALGEPVGPVGVAAIRRRLERELPG
jgi:chromosome segregation ATPase